MSISCRVTRGDLTESIHVAFAVIVDSSGSPFFATGDHQYVTCARSALKPFQAASIVETGAFEKAGFVEEELALMCASHNGESIHVDSYVAAEHESIQQRAKHNPINRKLIII